jgi:hypothetical protein
MFHRMSTCRNSNLVHPLCVNHLWLTRLLDCQLVPHCCAGLPTCSALLCELAGFHQSAVSLMNKRKVNCCSRLKSTVCSAKNVQFSQLPPWTVWIKLGRLAEAAPIRPNSNRHCHTLWQAVGGHIHRNVLVERSVNDREHAFHNGTL